MKNDDDFEAAALAGVKADLEENPENFSPDFVKNHIDLKKLARELHSDVYDSNYDSLNDEAERRPLQFLKDNDLDIPSPTDKQLREHAEAMDSSYDNLKALDPEDQWSEIGEEPTVSSTKVEEICEEQTKNQLRDPLQYLEDIYGEETTAKAIEIAGIDIEKAAEEAVRIDGAAHFMCHYDGNYDSTPSGFIVWRHN
jgi:hypothetical protein